MEGEESREEETKTKGEEVEEEEEKKKRIVRRIDGYMDIWGREGWKGKDIIGIQYW